MCADRRLTERDANGQSLAYVYSRETKDAHVAKVLTGARRIASNIAKLPSLLLRRAEKAAD
jgi:hypothetical protein